VCQTIKDSGAGVYYLAVSGTLALRLTALCKQAGVTAAPAIIGGSADTAQATSANNGLLEVDNNYPFYDSSIAASKAFQTAVAKYQPLKGAEYGSIAMWSWASAELFQKAATLAGKDITPASLKSALYSLKAETLGGISPPLTFTKDKPAFIACYFVYSVSGGKWTTSDGGKSACAPPALAKALAK
jgi:branched-chain amino acid transport system substrate-binding protein